MARRSAPATPKTNMRASTTGESDEDLVGKALQLYRKDVDADQHNIEPAREDIQFVIGDQWSPDVKSRRERLKKPALTINRLPAFVAQYVGGWLQNDTTVKVIPTRGGSKRVAEIRQGVIRTITRTRQAKDALNRAMTNAYICGIGNFEVSLKDAENDVFLRDIILEPVDDPLGVVWDRASREPTGADAKHCFVPVYMTRDDFEEAYPGAIPNSGWVQDEISTTIMTGHGWEIDDMVRVCKFWQMREEPVTLGLEAETGDVIDVTDMDETDMLARVETDDEGTPIVRDTVRPYAECYVMTSQEVLEGPFRYDVPRLPVFRVEGWSLQEASVRYRWGFVRMAKDPQRLHNYWRSVLAEELSKSVSGKWLVDVQGGNSMLDQFRHAHMSDDNVLQWDSGVGGMKPERIDPPVMNQAVMTEAGMSVQDIKDVTNKHEASMGVTSNEVSGKAINARQRVSEQGDVIYLNNMNAAVAEAGRVINAMIPQVYDTNRTVRIMGEDDQEMVQEINGIYGDSTPDVTVGKYDITYTTGPSYATKRQETVDVLMTLMNTMPNVGNVIPDLIFRHMDIPGAEEIEERLAGMLPPGTVNPEHMPASRRDKVLEKQQAQQKAQQKQQMLQDAQFKAEMAKLQAETAELQARAARQKAQANEALAGISNDRMEALAKLGAVEVDAMEAKLSGQRSEVEAVEKGLKMAVDMSNARAKAEFADTEGPQQGETPARPKQDDGNGDNGGETNGE